MASHPALLEYRAIGREFSHGYRLLPVIVIRWCKTHDYELVITSRARGARLNAPPSRRDDERRPGAAAICPAGDCTVGGPTLRDLLSDLRGDSFAQSRPGLWAEQRIRSRNNFLTISADVPSNPSFDLIRCTRPKSVWRSHDNRRRDARSAARLRACDPLLPHSATAFLGPDAGN